MRVLPGCRCASDDGWADEPGVGSPEILSVGPGTVCAPRRRPAVYSGAFATGPGFDHSLGPSTPGPPSRGKQP